MVPKLTEEVAVARMLNAGLRSVSPYVGVMAGWECECLDCGATVFPRLNNITNGQHGCPDCGHNQAAQIRKLSDKEAFSRMLDAELRPIVLYINVMEPWLCVCLRCGIKSTPRLNDITSGQGGCKKCGDIDGGKVRKVSSENAASRMLSAGLKPLEDYEDYYAEWKCECLVCGSIVFPALVSVTSGNGGCITCSTRGFDSTKEGFVYFLRSSDKINQIGITGLLKRRLRKHAQSGFIEIIDTYGPIPGKNAVVLERQILQFLKSRNVPTGKNAFHPDDQFDGYTESWWDEDFHVESLSDLGVSA